MESIKDHVDSEEWAEVRRLVTLCEQVDEALEELDEEVGYSFAELSGMLITTTLSVEACPTDSAAPAAAGSRRGGRG